MALNTFNQAQYDRYMNDDLKTHSLICEMAKNFLDKSLDPAADEYKKVEGAQRKELAEAIFGSFTKQITDRQFDLNDAVKADLAAEHDVNGKTLVDIASQHFFQTDKDRLVKDHEASDQISYIDNFQRSTQTQRTYEFINLIDAQSGLKSPAIIDNIKDLHTEKKVGQKSDLTDDTLAAMGEDQLKQIYARLVREAVEKDRA